MNDPFFEDYPGAEQLPEQIRMISIRLESEKALRSED
jgi:hypothetical protein